MPEEGRHWLVVSSPGNYRVTRDQGFRLQGIKSRHARKVARIRPGDRMLWYLTRHGVFAATATVTGDVYQDATPLWISEGNPDDYPWRVPIECDLATEPEEGLPATEVKDALEYLKKWPPEHWRLGLQGMLHEWPEVDFRLVERRLRQTGSGRFDPR